MTATKFVSYLYGKAECQSLNALRCEKASNKSLPAKKLPPTEDSFELHLLHCVYQLKMWHQAIIPMVKYLDPTKFGYEKMSDEKHVSPRLMTQALPTPEMLHDLVCNCKPELCGSLCTCFSNKQPYSAACVCESACINDPCDSSACANPLTQASHCSYDSDDEHYL